MNKPLYRPECVNYSLLLATVLIAVVTQVATHVGAQSSCTGEPPTGPNSFKNSWPANKNVSVRIDDAWSSSSRNALASGVNEWNGWRILNCSGVFFSGFEAIHFNDYAALPPTTRSTSRGKIRGPVLTPT